MKNVKADNEKITTKDNHELNAKHYKTFMSLLLFSGLARVAPYLSISRSADLDSISNLKVKTQVTKVEKLMSEGTTLLCIDFKSESESNEKRTEYIQIYSFRGVYGEEFDPFVCIAKEGDHQIVFAFGNHDQFIMKRIDGGYLEIIREVEGIAEEKGMRALQRYCRLMLKILNENELGVKR